MTSLDRVSFASLTPELFHQRYRSKSKPFIITGAFDGVKEWTLDVINDLLGTQEYNVRVYAKDYRSRPKRDWKKYSEIESHTPQAYIELLRNRTAHDNSMYMAQVAFGQTPLAATIRERVLQLEQKCDMETIHPLMDLNLWFGPGGHTEPLHFDTGDGTLMQLYGSKRVMLFAPNETPNLYPFEFYREIPPWFSQVDTDNPDPAVFPRYADAFARRIEVVVEQGEILYIPVSWWHEVTALGTDYVCSVNRFWKVKPVTRNFSHGRSSVFWLMNKVPWSVTMTVDRTMRKLLGRPA